MNIISLLASDGYITVNKRLLKEIGLAESVIFGLLCSEYNYWSIQDKLKDDKFYITIEKLENNTGLSYYQQQRAIKNLEDLEFITTSIEGVPACRYFKINENKVLNFFETSFQETQKLDFEKLNINNNIYNNKKEINNNTNVLLENQESEEHKNDVLDELKKDITETHKKATSSNRAKAKVSKSEFIGSAKKETVEKKPNRFQKCVSVIDEFYPNDEKMKELLIQYLKILFEQCSNGDRVLYVNQWRGLLNKLRTLESNGNNPRVVVQQSIDKGYRSFYQINTSFRAVTNYKDDEYINEVNDVNNSVDISQQVHIKKVY